MKNFKRLMILVLSLILLVGSTLAQTKNPGSTNPTVTDTKGLSSAEIDRRRSTELLPGQESSLRQLNNPHPESDISANILNYRMSKNLAMLSANAVVVPKQYVNKYETSLKDEKAFLARLLNVKCNDSIVVTVGDIERCKNSLQVWGGGSFYSFRNKSNFNSDNGMWADIRLIDGKFLAGSYSVQGIISRIGDANIENITLSSPEVRFLKEYAPKNDAVKIQAQKEALKAGISGSGFLYSTEAKAELNATYVLRSIAYRIKNSEPGDNRTDSIIAFNVVGVEKDGSLVILWKELRSDDAPRLKE